MKRNVEDWTIEKLGKERTRISFPEYQREPHLWSRERKRLLIDSILIDIDIPKFYFNKSPEGYEVVDGQQRLWAIWDYLDNSFKYTVEGEPKSFSELSDEQRHRILNYELQVVVLEDASDEYLRQLFLRLQLGLLLLTGEKLNAASGKMKSFIFAESASHAFIEGLGIPNRRFARETLAAQIAINSFTRAKLNTFARTRYEDLIAFLREYRNPKGADLRFFKSQSKQVAAVLDQMAAAFGSRARNLRSRSYALSLYLLFEEYRDTDPKEQKKIADFAFVLWKRLKEESKSGFDRKNRELYGFETHLSSAPGERYQIERRHTKLLEFYSHYRETGKVLGD